MSFSVTEIDAVRVDAFLDSLRIRLPTLQGFDGYSAQYDSKTPPEFGAGSTTWYLRAPAFSSVRSEFFDTDLIKAALLRDCDFLDDFNKFDGGMTELEKLILTYFVNILYPQEDCKYTGDPSAHNLWPCSFICCTCGCGTQFKNIPRIVFAAWNNAGGDPFEAMVAAAAVCSKYPLVLCATLSAYTPQKVYETMRVRLDDINEQLASLHAAMVIRNDVAFEKAADKQKLKDGSPACLDSTKEETLLSMLEQLYDYVTHGGSILSCSLQIGDTPCFVLDPVQTH